MGHGPLLLDVVPCDTDTGKVRRLDGLIENHVNCKASLLLSGACVRIRCTCTFSFHDPTFVNEALPLCKTRKRYSSDRRWCFA